LIGQAVRDGDYTILLDRLVAAFPNIPVGELDDVASIIHWNAVNAIPTATGAAAAAAAPVVASEMSRRRSPSSYLDPYRDKWYYKAAKAVAPYVGAAATGYAGQEYLNYINSKNFTDTDPVRSAALAAGRYAVGNNLIGYPMAMSASKQIFSNAKQAVERQNRKATNPASIRSDKRQRIVLDPSTGAYIRSGVDSTTDGMYAEALRLGSNKYIDSHVEPFRLGSWDFGAGNRIASYHVIPRSSGVNARISDIVEFGSLVIKVQFDPSELFVSLMVKTNATTATDNSALGVGLNEMDFHVATAKTTMMQFQDLTHTLLYRFLQSQQRFDDIVCTYRFFLIYDKFPNGTTYNYTDVFDVGTTPTHFGCATWFPSIGNAHRFVIVDTWTCSMALSHEYVCERNIDLDTLVCKYTAANTDGNISGIESGALNLWLFPYGTFSHDGQVINEYTCLEINRSPVPGDNGKLSHNIAIHSRLFFKDTV